MQSFQELSRLFESKFNTRHFPEQPSSLYEPAQYILTMGGKRVRPVLCLMGNELFDDISTNCWEIAAAIELFHNFTLIHDDIMDKAPLRRGIETVHKKYGDSTALLAGDVMMVAAYERINRVDPSFFRPVMTLFNTTAREVCEGQQLDIEFEAKDTVSFADYLNMIGLKTSVLLAASLKMGAILGGAGERNQNLIYEFGKKLGLAFQVQDDYLDAFGDPAKFGKQVGGDIIANKKTFLLIHAMETASASQQKQLQKLLSSTSDNKVAGVVQLFHDCGVDEWALELKNKFLDEAIVHLEDIAVTSVRKAPLKELADFLIKREY